MRLVRNLTRAAVVVACMGMLIPQGVQASGPTPNKSNDVALTPSGSLTGVVLDPQGQRLDGAVVTVRRGEKEVATAVSRADGSFEVAGLNSGSYDIAVGQHVAPIRVWSANAAPPTAKSQALLVTGTPTRAQGFMGMDVITLTTVTAAVGALVVGIVALDRINDVDDKIDNLASP